LCCSVNGASAGPELQRLSKTANASDRVSALDRSMHTADVERINLSTAGTSGNRGFALATPIARLFQARAQQPIAVSNRARADASLRHCNVALRATLGESC